MLGVTQIINSLQHFRGFRSVLQGHQRTYAKKVVGEGASVWRLRPRDRIQTAQRHFGMAQFQVDLCT
jgi:hypothetical protein